MIGVLREQRSERFDLDVQQLTAKAVLQLTHVAQLVAQFRPEQAPAERRAGRTRRERRLLEEGERLVRERSIERRPGARRGRELGRVLDEVCEILRVAATTGDAFPVLREVARCGAELPWL